MGAQGKDNGGSKSILRVKFYRLTANGKWDDQGTGLVTVDYVERSENLGLLVFDEDNHDPLLVHRISSDDIYRRQDDVESGSCLAAEDLPTSGAPQSNGRMRSGEDRKPGTKGEAMGKTKKKRREVLNLAINGHNKPLIVKHGGLK
ncbi:hypothetical protein QJS10_CPA05g00248 [Acorus calamus]|uniref:Uncharacterized protein n=1 Tax=Acorus calamus TaxID=4465 RepID=A0AAV9EVQ0_ACOCL|nr:hypothetical protein QJS10_CPA05g00248 [Acorus calamus]